MPLKTLEVVIGANTSGFQKGLNTVKSGLSSVKESISGVVKTGLAIAGVTVGLQQLGESLKAYTGLESNISRVNSLFLDSSKYITDFAENTAFGLGMAESSAYQYAATYGNLFRTITVSAEENAKVTIAMLKASAVISSKTGRTMDDVSERIRSGLLGSTEAIEDLGIQVNVASLEMSDAFRRIANGRSWEQLNYYEQQQIRTLSILEQAQASFGDEVDRNSAFNLSALSNAFKDLQATVGMFINKALQPVVQWLTELVQWANMGLKSLAALFGFDMSVSETATTGIGAQTKAQNGLTDAIKETAKANKRLLASFDEVNIIKQSTSGSGGSSGAVGGISSAFSTLPAINFDESTGSMLKFSETFKKIKPFFDGIVKAVKDIGSAVKSFYDTYLYSWLVSLGEWINKNPDALEDLGKGLAIVAVALLLFKGLEFISKLFPLVLTVTLVKIGFDGIEALFDDNPDNDLMGAVKLAVSAALAGATLGLVSGAGVAFSLKLSLVFAFVALTFAGIKMLTDDNEENDLLGTLVTAIGAALLGATLGIISGKGLVFTTTLTLGFLAASLLFAGIKMTFDESEDNDLLAAVTTSLGAALLGGTLGIISGKGLAFSTTLILGFLALSLLFNGIKGLVDENEGNNLFSAVETGIGSILGGGVLSKVTGLSYSLNLGLAFASLGLLFAGTKLLEEANTVQEKLFALILTGLGFAAGIASLGIVGSGLALSIPLAIVFNLTLEWVYNDGPKKLIDNVKEAVTGKNYFEGLGALGEKILNPSQTYPTYTPSIPTPEMHFIESGLDVITQPQKTPSEIAEEYSYEPFISTKLLKDKRLQGFATGGVVTSPTNALIGEYPNAASNPEIVSPQNIMYDTVVEANAPMVSAIVEAIQRLEQTLREKDLEISIGDDEIARSAARGNSDYIKRTGRSLLTV